jgi:hypothetical protein
MSEVPDIVSAVAAVKEKKIKRFQTTNPRASGIGYAVEMLDGCMRRGVYDITHWQEKKLHDVRGQFIFDEGDHQEKIVLADLAEAGIKVVNQQEPFQIMDKRGGRKNKVLMTGTLEGRIVTGEAAGRSTETLTFEIKSMNPNIFNVINSFEDFKKKPWTHAYMAQGMSYMLSEGEEKMIFILKDKSNGTLKQIEVPLDYELAEAVLKTAEEINDHVEADTLPNRRSDIDKCKFCPHREYCIPDVNFDVGPAVADDPDLENKIDEYMELVDSKKRADELYKKSISPKMKVSANGGDLNVTLGKYRLTGKTDAKGTFRPKIKLEAEVED